MNLKEKYTTSNTGRLLEMSLPGAEILVEGVMEDEERFGELLTRQKVFHSKFPHAQEGIMLKQVGSTISFALIWIFICTNLQDEAMEKKSPFLTQPR